MGNKRFFVCAKVVTEPINFYIMRPLSRTKLIWLSFCLMIVFQVVIAIIPRDVQQCSYVFGVSPEERAASKECRIYRRVVHLGYPIYAWGQPENDYNRYHHSFVSYIANVLIYWTLSAALLLVLGVAKANNKNPSPAVGEVKKSKALAPIIIQPVLVSFAILAAWAMVVFIFTTVEAFPAAAS